MIRKAMLRFLVYLIPLLSVLILPLEAAGQVKTTTTDSNAVDSLKVLDKQESLHDTIRNVVDKEEQIVPIISKPLVKLKKDELIDSIQRLQFQIDTLNKSISQLSDSVARLHQQQQKLANNQTSDSLLIIDLQRTIADTMNTYAIKVFGEELRKSGVVSASKTKGSEYGALFCYAVLESPLFYAYNDSLISRSLEMSTTLGYTLRGNPYHDIYLIYEPLLKNYNSYTQEIADAIENVIVDFKLEKQHINREKEKSRFLSSVNTSKYYAIRNPGPHGNIRLIYFLEYRISQVLSLFDSDKTFKVELFEKEHKKLTGK